MLPPVLETYVVWHPDDHAGARAAHQLVEHVHGTLFTGLIGGAIEVYVRHHGWRGTGDAPRPIPVPGSPPPNGVAQAQYVAVVPVLGVALARAVQPGRGAWFDYLTALAAAHETSARRVRIFPLLLADSAALRGSTLDRILGRYQRLGGSLPATGEGPDTGWRRDLIQGLAQFTGQAGSRLQVFISHTRQGIEDGAGVAELTQTVRAVIAGTRLAEFFDPRDLQAGQQWRQALRENAGRSALLALRTDLYASRGACQWEVLAAKEEGAPVVILDALERGEERGSFLMDHVPRVPVRRGERGWSEGDVAAGLAVLVDECLKRALWERQRELALGRSDLDVVWWAPHAPEPLTLARWLVQQLQQRGVGALAGTGPLRILHPDPPLGAPERLVLDQLARLSGITRELDVMTPRLLAARGG
ncbi:MAG: toll/interleukin-1 receptor domain-containing protein [Pseudonocardiales bacterium]|nr:toll/interleukin-1 receptor domain-containing protein [Pseudonocardiales bacterium]